MEEFLAALEEKGVDASKLDEEQLHKVAKAVGVDPVDYLPRKVEIVPYTNKRGETNQFVKTSSYVIGRKKDGSAQTVRGLFTRLETLDQMIEDFNAARGIRDSSSDEE